MAELTQSKHKLFAVTAPKGWAEVMMELNHQAGIAAGGEKRKRNTSDNDRQVKKKQLQQALHSGMPVAIYCGNGTSADSSGIPYWLAHGKGAQGVAAKSKFKVKKAFCSSGVQFKKGQWAGDLTQLDFKAVDRQQRPAAAHTDRRSVCSGASPVTCCQCPSRRAARLRTT
jgi:hypothetical protein